MKGVIDKTMRILFLLLPVVACLLVAGELRAEGVQARYLQNSGKVSVLEVLVEDPAPSSVIVQQQIPKGAEMVSATPGYAKYSAAKGVVKWLFKRPQPGKITIVINYSAFLPAGGATAVVRCKSPMDGKMMILNVQ